MEVFRFSRFSRFEFLRFEFLGFRFQGFQTRAPFGFAAEAVDTELTKEFEMVAELISGHD